MEKGVQTFNKERLRKAMYFAGIVRHYQLAELVGVARPTIGQYLSGRAKPRQCTLEKLAEVLDCTTTYLCGGH